MNTSQDRVREICRELKAMAQFISAAAPADVELWEPAAELSSILVRLKAVPKGWAMPVGGVPHLISGVAVLTEAPPCEAFSTGAVTPFRETWNLAHTAGALHGLDARIDSGRVLLAGNVMFDRLSPQEVNMARRDVLRGMLGLLPVQGQCADCEAAATGIDISRGMLVCDAHRAGKGEQ